MGKSRKGRGRAKARAREELFAPGGGTHAGGLREWITTQPTPGVLTEAHIHRAMCEYGHGPIKLKVVERAKMRSTIVDAHGEVHEIVRRSDGP